jgi:hypothetical protein
MKKNKISIFIAIAAIGFALMIQACNKNVNATEKTVAFTNSNVSFQVPIILRTSEYDSLTSFNFLINMDSFVKTIDSKFDTSNIQSVKFSSCVLTLDKNTTPDNFANFHTCSIGLTSGKVFNLVKIATATDISDTSAYFLNMPKSYDWELKNYFRSDSLHYTIFGNTSKLSTDSLACKATIIYSMTLSR